MFAKNNGTANLSRRERKRMEKLNKNQVMVAKERSLARNLWPIIPVVAVGALLGAVAASRSRKRSKSTGPIKEAFEDKTNSKLGRASSVGARPKEQVVDVCIPPSISVSEDEPCTQTSSKRFGKVKTFAKGALAGKFGRKSVQNDDNSSSSTSTDDEKDIVQERPGFGTKKIGGAYATGAVVNKIRKTKSLSTSSSSSETEDPAYIQKIRTKSLPSRQTRRQGMGGKMKKFALGAFGATKMMHGFAHKDEGTNQIRKTKSDSSSSSSSECEDPEYIQKISHKVYPTKQEEGVQYQIARKSKKSSLLKKAGAFGLGVVASGLVGKKLQKNNSDRKILRSSAPSTLGNQVDVTEKTKYTVKRQGSSSSSTIDSESSVENVEPIVRPKFRLGRRANRL